MGLFDSYQNVFKIGNTVSEDSNMDPDDVVKTKSALTQTGHYKVPEFGITKTPDQQMIKGIKKFQIDNDLKVDGVMKPNGPTETKIDESLKKPFQTQPNHFEEKVKKPKPPKIDLLTGLAEIKLPKLKKAIVPKGNTVDQRIQSIMTDKRYFQKKEKPIVDHVVRQFQRAYPGTTQYDETGKMIQPTPVIKPEEVEPFDPDGELEQFIAKNQSRPFISNDSNEPESEAGNVQIAAAPVLAFFPWLAGLLGVTAIVAQQTYNGWDISTQEEYDDKYEDYLDENDNSDDDLEADCDFQYYDIDVPRCNDVSEKHGKKAGAKCFSSASDRYAACLRGQPESEWPDLLD